MTREPNDEEHARILAISLRAEPRPRCPQLRPCQAEGRYPVQGYCVLADSPGWFMIPSIEEYRESCTTSRWGVCCWLRGDAHEGTEGGAALPAPGEGHRTSGDRLPTHAGSFPGGHTCRRDPAACLEDTPCR
jgi:hypothetical protein